MPRCPFEEAVLFFAFFGRAQNQTSSLQQQAVKFVAVAQDQG